MAMPTRKATFSLPEDVLRAVGEAVSRGAAPSKNALVERALARELREIRRQVRRHRWEEASRDPLFLQDVADVGREFQSADAQTARSID